MEKHKLTSVVVELQAWIWAYFPRFSGHTSVDRTAARDRRAAVRLGVEGAIKATPERLAGIRSALDHYTSREVRAIY